VSREAVRQRKALSRTSSNILLNSVQNQYNYQPPNNRPARMQNVRASDCDDELNLTIKEVQQESHSEVSDLEACLSYTIFLNGIVNIPNALVVVVLFIT